MTTPQDVLDFWFAPEHVGCWFEHDPVFDERIRARFARTLQHAAGGVLDAWRAEPAGWLAWLIVLDQFSRNLHRNDPRAWMHDGAAQAVAQAGIARGDDRQLPLLHRLFAYLPLEHAEDSSLQQQSVALFQRLRDEAPPAQRPRFEGFLDYARRHADVIAQFGRFPHRNAALGRISTPQERAWLAQPGNGF